MNYTAIKLIAIAMEEIGYIEKASNAQLDDKTANAGSNNYTKYARDLAAAGYYQASKQGFEWCDMFVDWLFLQLCGGDAAKAQEITCQTGPYGAGCEWSAKYYRAQNRFYTSDPQPGDQIFFGKSGIGSEEHTGIVEKVENGVITTIEGNTSNQVARRTYKTNDSYVVGFGRPKFEAETTASTPTTPATPAAPATSAASFKKGDIVSLTSDATYYSGTAIPSWVKAKQWIVCEDSVGDRAVINESTDGVNAINSPVNVKYLTLVQSAAETTAPATSTVKLDYAQNFTSGKAGAYVVNSSVGLRLRAGASTSKAIIETMANGSRVVCYGYHTGDWLYVVSASGKTGFCHSGYLKKA